MVGPVVVRASGRAGCWTRSSAVACVEARPGGRVRTRGWRASLISAVCHHPGAPGTSSARITSNQGTTLKRRHRVRMDKSTPEVIRWFIRALWRKLSLLTPRRRDAQRASSSTGTSSCRAPPRPALSRICIMSEMRTLCPMFGRVLLVTSRPDRRSMTIPARLVMRASRRRTGQRCGAMRSRRRSRVPSGTTRQSGEA
jgi:hypothetical protein